MFSTVIGDYLLLSWEVVGFVFFLQQRNDTQGSFILNS